MFQYLSEILINTIENNNNNFALIHRFNNNDEYCIEYRRNYAGIMANSDKYGNVRAKQGLFDFRVHTGSRYLHRNNRRLITHYNLFSDLLENSTWENCYYIWTGETPFNLTNDENEQQALLGLALLMFEQEINWGNEEWQKFTWFSPSINHPYKRPRDMILGILRYVFTENDVNGYPHWSYIPHTNIRTTPTFGGSYNRLAPQYKVYFEEISEWNEANPLMIGECLDIFRNLANQFPNNPNY